MEKTKSDRLSVYPAGLVRSRPVGVLLDGRSIYGFVFSFSFFFVCVFVCVPQMDVLGFYYCVVSDLDVQLLDYDSFRNQRCSSTRSPFSNRVYRYLIMRLPAHDVIRGLMLI